MASALAYAAPGRSAPGEVIPLGSLVGVATVIDALKAGDHAVWEAQYRRAYPGLLAYARRRLDLDDARDAVGETMARAVHKVSTFEARGISFDGWLYGILRHVVADVRRTSIRQMNRVLPPAAASAADASEGLLDHEEAQAVRQAFEELPQADQELLELRVVRRLSSDDVASILGKRPGAVRMSQSRAIERLRVEMERRYAP